MCEHSRTGPPEVVDHGLGRSDVPACVEIKFYGVFVLNHRVVLHAIDAMLARWRGDAGS